jgi:hypothetical protein
MPIHLIRRENDAGVRFLDFVANCWIQGDEEDIIWLLILISAPLDLTI